MRVTNNYVLNCFNKTISNSNRNMARLNNQVSSGNKIAKASEDPVTATKSIKVRR